MPPTAAYSLSAAFRSDLRRLYGAPAAVRAALRAEAVERALDLVRLVLGVEHAGLLLAGEREPRGDGAFAAEVDDLELDAPGARDGVLRLPLHVPLTPEGTGPARVFGVVYTTAAGAWEAKAPDLCRQVSALLLNDALAGAASLDRLTGLPTRDGFERRLASLAADLASGEPAALLLLDVDALSRLNATRGHAHGDEVLQTVASLLTAQPGVAGRWGSDELVLFVPRAEVDDAEAVARSLAQTITDATACTVSIGVACAPAHGQTAAELWRRAEAALAQAKTQGANQRVTWSETLLETQRVARRSAHEGILTGDAATDHQHVEALLQTVTAVSRLAPLREILTEVLDRCIQFADAERGFVLLRQDDGWTVHLGRRRGGRPLEVEDGGFATSIAEETHRTGQAVQRVGPEPISRSADGLGLQAVMCAPLRGEDVPEGAIYVDAHRPVGAFDAPTVAFFQALTAEVGTALRNAVLYERLLERAERLREDVAGRDAELARVRRMWARDREILRGSSGHYEQLVGASAAMTHLFSLMGSVENSRVPVCVQGESGTGKELVARAIHARSPCGAGPFVAESCAAISEDLFERELFGHCKGAFTGAHADTPGLLEAAHEGTLFLDEVGELPLGAQAKLLRCLQEGEVRRLGETQVRKVDVRIIVATHRDLQGMVQDGTFREDLYYRLAVFRLVLPPLRERPSDVPLLVEHMLEDLRRRSALRSAGVSPLAMEALKQRPWPGNVRQLRNAIERAGVLAGEGRIEVEHLEASPEAAREVDNGLGELYGLPLAEAKASFLSLYANRLVEEEGSIAAAARRAGASRQTLYRLLEHSPKPDE